MYPEHIMIYFLARQYARMPLINNKAELEEAYKRHITPEIEKQIATEYVSFLNEIYNIEPKYCADTLKQLVDIYQWYTTELKNYAREILVIMLSRKLVNLLEEATNTMHNELLALNRLKVQFAILAKPLNPGELEFTCPECGSHKLIAGYDVIMRRPVETLTYDPTLGIIAVDLDFLAEPETDDYFDEFVSVECANCRKEWSTLDALIENRVVTNKTKEDE